MKFVQENSEELNRKACLICGNITGKNSLALRNESVVCLSCLDKKEWERGGLELKIVEANTSKIKIYYYSFEIFIALGICSLVMPKTFS